MYVDPLNTTVPIRITMGACRFEHLVHHWRNPETVAEEIRRATIDDTVTWARQQSEQRALQPVVVPIVGRRPEPEAVQLSGISSWEVTPAYDDASTETMDPVQLVAEKDPLPWVQPSIEEMKDFQNLWDDNARPSVAARVAGTLTVPFRRIHRARSVQDGSK